MQEKALHKQMKKTSFDFGGSTFQIPKTGSTLDIDAKLDQSTFEEAANTKYVNINKVPNIHFDPCGREGTKNYQRRCTTANVR